MLMADNDLETNASGSQKDVPLGPACLVVAIFAGVGISLMMILASWMLLGKQGERAEAAIQTQLIPWIAQSPLDPTDKSSVTEQLNGLVVQIKANRFDDKQLMRLFAVLSDSPLLQWGVIQQVNSKAAKSGLTEAEREALQLESDRLLRFASTGGLSMQQLEFIVQPVAVKDRKSGTLTMIETATDANLREYLQRTKSTCDRREVSNEPYPTSVSQVLKGLIEMAIEGPKPEGSELKSSEGK
jgi:hypothetical protein